MLNFFFQAEKVENLQEEIKELQDKLNRHQKMIETALNQRDMYKKLYEQDSSSVNLARSRTPVNKSKTELTPITPSGDIQNIKNELKMVYYFYLSNSFKQNSNLNTKNNNNNLYNFFLIIFLKR